MFNVLLIARAPLQLFQAIQTSILPHLTRLRASGDADPFHRSVMVTLTAIAAFAGSVAVVMAAIGPWPWSLFFGGDVDYGRGGLVIVSIGMGLYLSAATLNQAALARGRAKEAAACWWCCGMAFVAFLLLPGFDDRVLQVEVGFVQPRCRSRPALRALPRRVGEHREQSLTGVDPGGKFAASKPVSVKATVHVLVIGLIDAASLPENAGLGRRVPRRGVTHPHLPPLRGHLRPRGRRSRARDVVAHPRRRGGRLQPRLPLPEGHRRCKHAARGPRPAAHAAGARRRRRASSRSPGTRRSPRSTRGLSPILERARPRRGGRLPRQPERPQPVAALLYGPRAAEGARHAATSSPPAPSTRCPSTCRAGLMFGGALSIPVPDVDRTDYLLILGANPLASNGSLLTAPDMRGRLRAHPRARGQGRGGRPAPQPHRRGRRRAPLHPPGHRRAPAVRAWCTRCSTRGWPTPGAGRACRTGSTRCEAAGARLHARGGGAARAASRPTRSGGMARELAGRRARRRVRAHRHLHAGVRHAGQLAGGRAERRSPATSTARAARCSPAPPPAQRNTRGHAGQRQGRHASAAGRAACAGCPRCSASCRSPAWPRRSTPPARARSAR